MARKKKTTVAPPEIKDAVTGTPTLVCQMVGGRATFFVVVHNAEGLALETYGPYRLDQQDSIRLAGMTLYVPPGIAPIAPT